MGGPGSGPRPGQRNRAGTSTKNSTHTKNVSRKSMMSGKVGIQRYRLPLYSRMDRAGISIESGVKMNLKGLTKALAKTPITGKIKPSKTFTKAIRTRKLK